MDSAIRPSDDFLNALPVGVMVLDPDRRVLLYNEPALRFLGIGITDLLASDVGKAVQNREFDSCLARVLENSSKREQVAFNIHGKRVNCVAQRLPFLSEESVLITLEDVTRIKEFEDLKHEFIETILHRLRSPLSTLETTLSIVTSNKVGILDPKVKTILDMSYQEVIRLHALSRDLRDLFFIETGLMQKELEIEDCKIGNALERAVVDLERMPAPFSAIRQRVKIKGDPESTVQADFDKLKQILINLLKNAVQYSPNGEKVLVRLSDHSGCVSIQIQDNGIGISDDSVGFVFDKFFREDNPVTRKTPGNGLGLFNAKALVEIMGGVIYCESEKGTGSSFWVNLPSKQGNGCCVEK